MINKQKVDFSEFSCVDVPAIDGELLTIGWEHHSELILNLLRTVVMTIRDVPDAKVGALMTLTESYFDPPRVTEFKVIRIEPGYPLEYRVFTFEEIRTKKSE